MIRAQSPAVCMATFSNPGCDGIYTTCQAYDSANNPTGKFNNYLNFGGEPFTPGVNPSAVGQFNLGLNGAKK